MPNKTCPQCGAKFTCNIAAGEASCWCFDLPNIIQLETITDDHTPSHDCLCPDCLQNKINTQQKKQASQHPKTKQ